MQCRRTIDLVSLRLQIAAQNSPLYTLSLLVAFMIKEIIMVDVILVYISAQGQGHLDKELLIKSHTIEIC